MLIASMADSEPEWWEDMLAPRYRHRPSGPHPVVESVLPSAPQRVVESVLPSVPQRVVESVLPSAPQPVVVESVLPSAPHPVVESVLPSAPRVVESSLPSALVPQPLLGTTLGSTAVLLPLAESDTPQRMRSSHDPSGQAAQVALACARAQADASDRLIRAGWWHALVPNGIRTSIAWEADVFIRLPLNEPRDSSQWLEHLVREVRAISGRYFYIGITDNPAHRWQMHVHSRTGWATMYVIGVARSSRTTAAWERQLIHQFANPLRCANSGAGGECASAGNPHFLYCIFRSDGLLRRAPGGGGTRRDRGSVADFLAEHR